MKNLLERPIIIPSGRAIYGTSQQADFAMPVHKNFEKLKDPISHKTKYAVHAANYPEVILDLDFLAGAADAYNISPNPADYIMVPVGIVTVGIPNRNLQAFPIEEAAYFDVNQGRLVYQTFMHKPTFVEHDNQVPKKASGVHADSSMQYVPDYDVWKIQVVTMWCRQKNPALAQRILKNQKNGFSMGAYVNLFSCSLCGTELHPDKGVCKRGHVKGKTYGDKNALTYQQCLGVTWFETSWVASPADVSATTPYKLVQNG